MILNPSMNMEGGGGSGQPWTIATLGELPRSPVSTLAPSVYITSYVSAQVPDGCDAIEVLLGDSLFFFCKIDGTEIIYLNNYGSAIAGHGFHSFSDGVITVYITWEDGSMPISTEVFFRATNHPE